MTHTMTGSKRDTICHLSEEEGGIKTMMIRHKKRWRLSSRRRERWTWERITALSRRVNHWSNQRKMTGWGRHEWMTGVICTQMYYSFEGESVHPCMGWNGMQLTVSSLSLMSKRERAFVRKRQRTRETTLVWSGINITKTADGSLSPTTLDWLLII